MNWLLVILIAIGLATLVYGVFFLDGAEGDPDKSGALFGDLFRAKKEAAPEGAEPGLGRVLSEP